MTVAQILLVAAFLLFLLAGIFELIGRPVTHTFALVAFGLACWVLSGLIPAVK